MALLKLGGKKIYFGNCGNAIAENVKKKKKNCFGNCGNPIAENVKKKKKIYFGNCENIVDVTIFFLLIHRFHNFFFHFRQWDCHNCQNNFFFFFFFTFSAMPLP